MHACMPAPRRMHAHTHINAMKRASDSANAGLLQRVEQSTRWIKSFANNHREHVDDEEKKHLEEVQAGRGAWGGVQTVCCA